MIVALITTVFPKERIVSKEKKISDPEIARSMTYSEVEEGEESTYSEYVKFDAFFLRDLDGDGYAEKIRGTCREIGKEDTLYIELRINANGRFENGEITINGENFYLQTALPKDDEIKENVIGNNIKRIRLETIENGTQKLLTGIVKSGDYSYSSKKASAIGNDTANYSKINSITLTGTHIADDGTVTELIGDTAKVVNFQVDWHGKTQTQIINKYETYDTLGNAVDVQNNEIKLSFYIETQEELNELILSKSYIEGTIPELNGYSPKKVNITGENVNFTYDETTSKFTAYREAKKDETGKVVSNAYSEVDNSYRRNKYRFEVTYDLEAFRLLGLDTVELRIPVEAYYEGYNNESKEFTNPYKSNIDKDLVIAKFRYYSGIHSGGFNVQVGKYVSSPQYRWIVSKKKPLRIYNGLSEAEYDDTYIVRWYCDTGTLDEYSGITMRERASEEDIISDKFIRVDSKEESMENVTSNIGIYFSEPSSLLGGEGWIKVYNDVTNEELVVFTKENWSQYTEANPYIYNEPVKHIRIETSAPNKDSSIYVYNIKELDDNYITENYNREQFNELVYIQSRLVGCFGEAQSPILTNKALYEAPVSTVKVDITPNVLSTQETKENVKIKITTQADEKCNEEKWKNGSFLLKLPEEIIDLEVEPEVNNSRVSIINYEVYEESGSKFIKILTENEEPTTYILTLNAKITPDPRTSTVSRPIELYATNENCENYYYKIIDKYDINNNLNTSEDVGTDATTINLVSPNSLLTNQVAKNYDDKESIAIGPQVGIVGKNQKKATIELEIKNNYSNSVSEISILGRIPTANNRYAINGRELGSNYSTTLTEDGIRIPEELQPYAKIYYSEVVNPDKDIDKEENEWKLDNIDFTKVKSYLIVLDQYVMPKDKKHSFSYEVNIPEGLNYNQIAYSHHGVYFSLNTDEGLYRTSTEPNKLGLMIAKEFDIEITKYQKDTDKKVYGATYSVTEENAKDGKTKVTNVEGIANIKNLYIEKTYIIEEIRTSSQYALNEDKIRIKVGVKADGTLEITEISGNLRKDTNIEIDGNTIKLQVEDEVRAKLNIVKKEQGKSDNFLKGVKYRLTGKGYETGKILTTNINGEASIDGLYIDQEYILEEIKAEGYYLSDPIRFKIINNNGAYELLPKDDGTHKRIEMINDFPVLKIDLEDEKIPTYDLEILKVKKYDESNKGLSGAQFKLEGEGLSKPKYYTTDVNGNIAIQGLYQYKEGKNLECKYTLTEIFPPEGYSLDSIPIVFRAQIVDGELKINLDSGNIKSSETIENKINVVIENTPIFSLTKYAEDGEEKVYLPNARFRIYALDENRNTSVAKDIKGNTIREIVTNENGEITLELPEGAYKVVEIEAPEGYELPEKESDRTYEFGIGKSIPPEMGMKVVYGENIGSAEWPDESNVIASTNDGGYIVGGSIEGEIILKNGEKLTTTKEADGKLIKYNRNGEIEWAKIINETNTAIKCIKGTSDGGFIVGGGSAFTGIIIKYNINGEEEWKINRSNEIIDIEELKHGEEYDGFVAVESSSYGTIIRIDNNGNIQWTKKIGGDINDAFSSIGRTSLDGGFIVCGSFEEERLTLENGDVLINTNYKEGDPFTDIGVMIKLNSSGDVEWGEVLGTHINKVATKDNGEFIIAGTFKGTITLNNGDVLTAVSNHDWPDIMIVKYTEDRTVEWSKKIGSTFIESINSILITKDHGYLLGGQYSYGMYVDDIYLPKNRNYAGMVIKLNENGKAEWVKSIGGQMTDFINGIIEISSEKYIAVGVFSSESLTLENGEKLNNTSGKDYSGNYNEDGMLIRIEEAEVKPEIAQKQSIEIKNNLIKHKITTEIGENLSGERTGGTITGEYNNEYPEEENIHYIETVEHGKKATQTIEMQPESDYEIIEITINGKKQEFATDENGKYSLLLPDIITEDKHIVVTYSKKPNKIVINKVSNITGEKLQGAKFEIKEYDERSIPENVIGELQESANVEQYILLKDKISTITSDVNKYNEDDSYYFMKNEDGTYSPNNIGEDGTTAYSYVPINLEGLFGEYAIKINATVLSETGYDAGFATITKSTDNPEDIDTYTLIPRMSGDISKNYTSTILNGGETYYLHLAYTKDGSVSASNESFVVNSIELYSISEEKKVYKFEKKENDTYVSNNEGYANSTAKSCIPIDLTGCYGKYNLIVNAEISSEEYADYGYATITNDTTTPSYSNSDKRFIYISGKQSAKNYTIVLDGNQKYYLHLGYYKDESDSEDIVKDRFTINKIELKPNEDNLYKIEIETNTNGQAIAQIPYGKYTITEVEAPKEYWLNEEPLVVEFTESGEHEFTIANTKKEKVTVHHYKIDRDGNKTEEKVAEDDIVIQGLDENGKPAERYSSKPHLDLQKYDLQKDTDGNYIIPENAAGRYDENDKDIIYYYVEKQIPITVHHYIEGTLTPVPLAEGVTFEELVQDGYTYEDNSYKSSGYEEEPYTTSAIPNDKLSADYELVKMPENYEGQFSGDEIIVNYYYKKVRRNVNLVKYAEDGVTVLEGAKFTIDGTEYVTNSNGRISVELESGKYEITEVDAPEGYQLPENPTTNITITRETIEENVSVINKRKQGKVIVYHYIEDTEDFVPLNDGTTAVPDEREETIGEMYATKPLENVAENYEYISCEGETSGIYEEGTKVVKYYYTEIKISGSKSWTTNVNRIMLNADGETVKYVQEGDIITYTITARNDGKHDKEIVIKDDVPDGTTFVGNVKINGVADNTKTEENLKEGIEVNVPTGGEVTVSFDVGVNLLAEGIFEREIRNIAVVNGKNTEPEVVIPVKKPNVILSKSANPATTEENKTKVKVGDEITYSIELNNSIGTAPIKVRVKDGAPVGTAFVEGSMTLESSLGSDRNVDLSSKTDTDLKNTGIDVELEAGEIKTLSFTVTVIDTDDGKATDLSNNTPITNIAQVSKNPEDTTPTYEDTNEITHIYVEPIITAEKTWKAEQERTYTNKEGKKIQYVLEGDTIEYTITATNEGGLGKDVKVVDILQSGMTFVEGSIKVNGRDTAYTLDDLQATGITVNVPAKVGDTNGTATVSFKVTVDELGEDVSGNQIYFGQLKNKATVDGKDTTEVVTNVNKSNIIFGKTINIAGKEANGQKVRIGDELTYNISVSNTGSLPDTVTISDSVPTNTEYVDDSVSVKVGDTTYTADEIETGVEGITIVKTGDTVTGVQVENTELYPGEDIIVIFEVKVTRDAKDGDTITNIATVNGKETEPVTNPVVRPIIDVQKEIAEVTHMNEDKEIEGLKDRKDYVFRGDKITYNIKATNAGGVDGKVIIKDIISDKVKLDVESIRIGGTSISGMIAEKFASDGIEVTVPAKTADGNGEVILSFTVTVKGDASVVDEAGVVGDVVNKATWKYEKPIEDPNPSNPENPEVPKEHETKEVKVPIVVIEKKADIIRTTEENQTTVLEDTVTAKDEIKYTIIVTNTGTSATGRFVVADDIPEGTTILNSNGGTINDKTISWTIDKLSAKQEGKEDNKAEISFTVTVDYDAVLSKNIVNIAYVNDKPTNETETPYEKPTPKMTTSVTKTSDEITMLGNQIYYKITYTATIEDFVGKANIVIEDQLPYEIIESKSNLEYISTDGTVSDKVIEASKKLELVEVNGKTIKWEMTEKDIDTYKTGNPHEIKLVKEMLLYYDTTTLPESIVNTAVATTQLKEPDLANPGSDKNIGEPDIAKSTYTVTVKTAYKLPETGRNGTTIFAIIGLMIVGVAVVTIYKIKH